MKKIISVIALSFTLFCGSLFAESKSGCSAGDNLFIFEVTGAGSDNLGAVIGLLPRFVLGVNAQLK
ncbi:MAG: hypothetical protein Q4B64_12510 [Spirochaetales bacterium]|nr:hypothetical protein [Spirochaetales bacterium]